MPAQPFHRRQRQGQPQHAGGARRPESAPPSRLPARIEQRKTGREQRTPRTAADRRRFRPRQETLRRSRTVRPGSSRSRTTSDRRRRRACTPAPSGRRRRRGAVDQPNQNGQREPEYRPGEEGAIASTETAPAENAASAGANPRGCQPFRENRSSDGRLAEPRMVERQRTRALAPSQAMARPDHVFGSAPARRTAARGLSAS